MKILKIFICILLSGSQLVDGNGLGSNRLRIYEQYTNMGSSAILSSNSCNLRNLLDDQLYETVKPEVKKIGGCFDDGLVNILQNYTNDQNLPANPKFMCETYNLTHNCIRQFIPHLAVCLDNVENTTVTKLYAGGEIGLNILCANSAEMYKIIYQNRHKKCIKHFIRRYNQKFKDIWGLSESVLFSTVQSCSLLAQMVRKIQNRPPNCSEQLANILKTALEQFWNKSGCSSIL